MLNTISAFVVFGVISAFAGFALCAILSVSKEHESIEDEKMKKGPASLYRDRTSGKTYEVMQIAENTETGERFVIYCLADGISPVWATPAKNFYNPEKIRRKEDKSDVKH